MDTITQLAWLSFLAAAFLLHVSKRGNLAIVLGLFGLGVQGLVFALANWGVLDDSLVGDFAAILGFMPVLASLLLVAGVVTLARGGAPTIGASTTMLDAQGIDLATLFTPRNETNTFSQAERLRDDACARLVERAKAAGLGIIEQRSQAHSPGVWFRLDYLLSAPNPDLSLCASVAVDIERFDFHRFEHTYTIATQVGARKTTVSGLLSLDDSAADRIHQHIITPGKQLRLTNRVREWPWQVWRPRNKVTRLGRDWLTPGLTLLAIVLAIIPFVGIILMVGIFIGLYVRARRRRTYVLTSGKPLTDPRSLRWMDSWQVSIGGLGALASTVEDGIMTRLKSVRLEGASIAVERIGYWGTDSWVEREQIVVRHRRAIGFVHVAPYSDVLYVARECHLNSASWVEQTLAAGLDRASGLDVVANRVVAGSHRLNEYDVSDSNFLAEWMHEIVRREVTLRMAEQKIDQEIDFTVQRESRKDAIAALASTPTRGRFKRLA